jgi:hypothetical protein
LINILLGIFGELIMKWVPVAAMLVPLAGIGFTWLALNQIASVRDRLSPLHLYLD